MVIMHKAISVEGKEVTGFLTKMWGTYHIIPEDDENSAYPVLEHTIEPYNVELLKYEEISNLNNGLKLLQSENDIILEKNEKLVSENLIYKNFSVELLDRMLKEIDKDGWCRLMITKEDILKFKEKLNLLT